MHMSASPMKAVLGGATREMCAHVILTLRLSAAAIISSPPPTAPPPEFAFLLSKTIWKGTSCVSYPNS